jgi:fatty acid desaturase
MNLMPQTADKSAPEAGNASAKPERLKDDVELIRAAAQLTRELSTANPTIYWVDFLASVVIGYGALVVAILSQSSLLPWLAGLISVLGLYRAGSFIHELTHLKPGAVPGFRTAWNLLIGVPLLIASYMYEGVHTLHHARTRYGTADDPEYLPLALMKPWTVAAFVGIAAFAPVALLFRSGLLSPLSLIAPPVRKLLVERYSALSINPSFRRSWPEGAFRKSWLIWETATSLWAIAVLSGVWTEMIPLRGFLIALAILSCSIILNQVRTLVAHLWQNDGEPMSVTLQFLDSVNVPPPGLLPALWAPVGLRYHAIHHLLPSLPYHALGEAHRRLMGIAIARGTYERASYRGLFGLVRRLVGATLGSARSA